MSGKLDNVTISRSKTQQRWEEGQGYPQNRDIQCAGSEVLSLLCNM